MLLPAKPSVQISAWIVESWRPHTLETIILAVIAEPLAGMR